METEPSEQDGRLQAALALDDPSVRLQAALHAGTHPAPGAELVLIERCAIEPDFYVREMLTWALARHPVASTLPLLLAETGSAVPQARSQALHTLSKIGDPRGWAAITPALLRDPDDQVARSAWRAAVLLVPDGDRTELAHRLMTQLGRGTRDVRLSLSRALIALGEAAAPGLSAAAGAQVDPTVRAHALATEQLRRDPESGFDTAVFEAQRLMALTGPDAPPPTLSIQS